MSVTYSVTAINDRLQGVVTAIDQAGNGNLLIRSGATTLSTIQLARPSGTVNGGILTFSGQLLDPSAAATGVADNAVVQDGNGNNMIFNLSVGIPLSGRDVIVTNGLNSTLISSGQVVSLLSAQITGS